MPDASWGYTAEEGLKAVLGDKVLMEKINKKEGAMTPLKMRIYIEAAPSMKNVSYSDEARRFAKALLEIADCNPDVFSKESKFIADQVMVKSDYDLTGFMWGWAVNAVRYVLGEKPIRNPAIISLGKEE